jgi:hypothetical protein
MKSVLLAGCATIVYLMLVTVLFRLTMPRSRALAMLKLFVATVPVLGLIHVLTPADLWLLPAWLIHPTGWVDLGFMVFLYSAAFFGGSLQLYNLAERGFSLTMMTDIVESGERGMSLADVRKGYSRGHGIAWMFQKRIDDMQAGNLVKIEAGDVVVQERGERIARLAGWVRDFMHLENTR